MKTTTDSIRNTIRLTAVLTLLCFLCAATAPSASAAESWKATFDEICGKVQGADSLSDRELTAMIEKADKILPEIQKSDDPAKKVYLQRLKKCRNLYEFMLDTRKSGGK